MESDVETNPIAMKSDAKNNYTAMEIAKYAINKRYQEKKPISNLQLQKILYFLQLIFAVSHKKLLFDDEFEAWPYGPVIESVYRKFSDCGGFPIQQKFAINIKDEDTRQFLDAGIDFLAEKSPWDLVRISHADGSPWDKIYNRKGCHKGIIPNELILKAARGQ